MQNCFSKFTNAPIEYINQLRSLKSNAISMKGTTFYPAFPLALLSSILCICGLSGYMIYYFITIDQNPCFQRITFGILLLAIIYPIESIVIYVCLFGSVVLSTTKCWKVFTMIFFGLLATGFSFGGLGFAFLCTLDAVNPILIPAKFISSNTFIQIIVYCYISFFIMYIVLLPLLTISHNNRSKDPQPQSSCFDTLCCVLYYFCQILFMITALFMICVKIIGPPMLIYVLIEVVRAGLYNSIGHLGLFFTLCMLSLCLPMFLFVTIYIIANCCCKQKQKKEEQNIQAKDQTKSTQLPAQTKQRKSSYHNNHINEKRKSIFLPPEDFSAKTTLEDDSTGINNDML